MQLCWFTVSGDRGTDGKDNTVQETTEQVYETPELAEIGDYADLTLGTWGWCSDWFAGRVFS